MTRDQSIPLVVTQEELDMMNVKASAEGISRTELIVRAVRDYGALEDEKHPQNS